MTFKKGGIHKFYFAVIKLYEYKSIINSLYIFAVIILYGYKSIINNIHPQNVCWRDAHFKTR